MEERDVRLGSAWRRYSRYNRRYTAKSAFEVWTQRARSFFGFCTILVALVPVAITGIWLAALTEALYGC